MPAEIAPETAARALITPGARLRPPRLPARLLDRPVVEAVIRGWQAHRLTLITAPAGYGKTTLAAAALQAAAAAGTPLHSVWLALDEDDDDCARFVLLLALALNRLLPGQARSVGEIAFGANNPRQAMTHLLAAVEEAALPVLVVLDDFHRLQSQSVRDLMSHALERSPDNLRWMILARHAAPVPLGKLRLQEQICEISAEALRLSRAEIDSMARRSGLSALDESTLDLLEARTHGWIAGLHLTLLSLQRTPAGPAPTGPAPTGPAPTGPTQAALAPAAFSQTDAERVLAHLRNDNDLLTEYLTTEVLARLAEPLRSFLLECAIVERMHPGLCTAMTGIAQSRQVLGEAVAQQLFVRALQGDGDWFEMHHLFRDLLLRQLRMERSVADVQLLYRRAADWHLAQQDVASAVRALLAGNLPHLAAEVVQQRTRQAMAQNDFFGPIRWINLLPAAQVEIRPQLLIDQAWAAFMVRIDLLPAALQRARAGLAARSARSSAAGAAQPAASGASDTAAVPAVLRDELAALTLAERYRFGPHAGLFEDARAVAAACQPESYLARALALLEVALNAPLQLRDVAHAAILRSVEEFAIAGISIQKFIFDWWQAVFEGDTVNPLVAVQACERILLMGHPTPFGTMLINGMRADILCRLDRTEEAAEGFARIQAYAEHYDDPYFRLYAHVGLALCQAAQGRFPPQSPESRQAEDALWSRFASSAPPGLMAQVMLYHLWRCALTGTPQEGWRRFAILGIDVQALPDSQPQALPHLQPQALPHLQPQALPDEAEEILWLALLTARVLHGVDLDRLLPSLERLLARTTADGRLKFSIPLRLLHALIEHRLGRRNRARGILRRALHDVEQTGYVRMVLDLPGLLPLLRVANSAFADQLAARMEACQAAQAEAARAVHGSPAQTRGPQLLTDRQLSILRLLSGEQSIEEIAHRLSLSVETVRWHRKKIYAVLGVSTRNQALAVARARGLL